MMACTMGEMLVLIYHHIFTGGSSNGTAIQFRIIIVKVYTGGRYILLIIFLDSEINKQELIIFSQLFVTAYFF